LKDSPSYGIQLEADEDQKMNVSWLPVVWSTFEEFYWRVQF
jgi:hypothetical protein